MSMDLCPLRKVESLMSHQTAFDEYTEQASDGPCLPGGPCMEFRRIRADWLTLVAGALWAVAGQARAQGPAAAAGSVPRPLPVPAAARILHVPLDGLPPAMRNGVRLVLEQPTLSIQGPAEVFRGRPAVYR